MDEMKTEFTNFVNKLNPNLNADHGGTGGSWGNDVGNLGGLTNSGAEKPPNISTDIDLSNTDFKDLKFVGAILADFSWLETAVTYFRPIINGFLGWLLFMFYYNQFLSFIGQAPMMAQSHNDFEAWHEKTEKSGD